MDFKMEQNNKSEIELMICLRCMEESLRKQQGIFPEREDLNFRDVVSPKILNIINAEDFLDIFEDKKSAEDAFLENGVSKQTLTELEKKVQIIKKQCDELGLNKEINNMLNNAFSKAFTEKEEFLLAKNDTDELKAFKSNLANMNLPESVFSKPSVKKTI